MEGIYKLYSASKKFARIVALEGLSIETGEGPVAVLGWPVRANVESDEAKWMSLIRKASQHQRFETCS